MHFAHQQGIIHRDLKPANILLSSPERKVESREPKHASGLSALDARLWAPKITDFGLAKDAGDDSAQTKTGAALGTPSYIAPEQAAGKKDIGPAVDIYSLGAILYELLTGRAPFRGESPMDTMLQVMSEEPVPPSRLQPKAPRDLETICLKCLGKDPARRYATALALADDLARFQDAKPIAARPIGPVGRGQRWARRNPMIAGLSVALLLALVTGLFAVTVLWRRAEANFADAQSLRRQAEENLAEAERQRERAEKSLKEADKQRKSAEANFRQARQAVDEFFTKVSDSKLLKVPGLQPLRKELLEAALKYYQKFAEEHGNDPAVQHELATTFFRVAQINSALGAKAKALLAYQQSRDLSRKLVQKWPDDVEITYTLAAALNNLNALYLETGNFDQGKACLEESLELWEKLVRLQPTRPELQRARSLSLDNLGHLHASTGQVGEGFRLMEQARVLHVKLVQDHPTVGEYREDLARSHHHIGYLQYETGQLAPALQNLNLARDSRAALAQANPGLIDLHNELGRTYTALGELHGAASRAAEAEKAFAQGRELRGRLARENPSVPRLHRDLAHTYYRTGRWQRAAGKPAEALTSLQQARDIQQKLVDDTGANEVGRTLTEIAVRSARPASPRRRSRLPSGPARSWKCS